MKITFFIPTLAAGKDGVADYTLQLAAECAKFGHTVKAVGFHDALADAKIVAEGPVRTLRLPQAMAWSERLAAIREFRGANTGREVASLQFVPYAFQPKGLVMGWAQGLQAALGGSKLHVMFHELWLGTAIQSPWKHRIIGPMQRHLILKLLRALQPSVVHTSNGPYVELLRRSGVAASVLPLLGNIPVQPRDDQFPPILKIANRNEAWLMGFFGVIHPEWSPEPWFSELEKTGKRIVFVQLGRAGAGEAVWKGLTERYGQKFEFLRMGEQSREEVSQWLQHLDFGVATSPWELIEKSSVVASMRGHGLPVIVTRMEKLFPFACAEPQADGLIPYRGGNFLESAQRARRSRPLTGRSPVAAQFLESFAA